ncbi:MAG: DNA repair and recombination protein RadA [Candidatus Alkanophagales archaeon]|nr:MAG: DNA repair and recombination protein RadA [Candidatus Alkanophagales archaeon]
MGKKKKTKTEINFKTAYELWQERQNIKRLETKTPIDELIGGGIEEGEVVEFYGEYGSGKTQTALTLATRVAGELGEDVVFIDCESTFKPERVVEIAKARGLDPEKTLQKIYLIQPITVEEQMEALDQIPKNVKPKLLVVDGVTTLFREEYVGRGELAERQGLLRRFLRKLLTYVRENKIYGVITNQVYGNPESSPFLPLELRELAVGGHSLYHTIDNRIFIRKAQRGTRIARLVDSSRYPPAERPFMITDKGIEPIEK